MKTLFLDLIKLGKSQVCVFRSMFKQSLVEIGWDMCGSSRVHFFLKKAFLKRSLYSQMHGSLFFWARSMFISDAMSLLTFTWLHFKWDIIFLFFKIGYWRRKGKPNIKLQSTISVDTHCLLKSWVCLFLCTRLWEALMLSFWWALPGMNGSVLTSQSLHMTFESVKGN